MNTIMPAKMPLAEVIKGIATIPDGPNTVFRPLDPHLLLNQIVVVLLILLLCLLYPMVRMFRMPIAAGLKGGAHAG